MSEVTFSFSNIAVIISVPIRIITGIILLAFVIPLQAKFVNVKNGLAVMRKAWIIIGILLFLINTVGLFIIAFKPFLSAFLNRGLTDVIGVFNSVGFLIVAILMYLLWKGQFTPKNIKLHEKIEKQEKKEDKAKVDNKASKR